MRLLLVLGLVAFAAANVNIVHSEHSQALIKHLASLHKGRASKEIQVDIANQVVDSILAAAKTIMVENGYDPMKIPDINTGFSFKPIIIEYTGTLNLTKGWLTDAATIYRLDSCALSYNENLMNIKIPIGFADFLFDFQYTAKLMNIGPSGGVDGKCLDIKISIDVILDLETLHLTLKDFQVIKTGNISVKFSGNPLLDWVFNILSGVVTGIFKGLILDISESLIKGTIEAIFEAINNSGTGGGAEAIVYNVAPYFNRVL